MFSLYLRSTLFTIGAVITMVVFSLLALLVWPLPYPVRFRIISQWARFNLWWVGVTCGLKYRVLGKENIPDTPAIVYCKHQSTWETFALQILFPVQTWILKRELLKIPIFGWGLAVLEPIAIDRKAGRKAVQQIVKGGIERLKQGRWVVIFPEGTRIPFGEAGRYRLGGAILAVESGRPLVPVAHNAGKFWARHSFVKKPGMITLVIGPPIDPEGMDPHQLTEKAKDWIETTVKQIERDTEAQGL